MKQLFGWSMIVIGLLLVLGSAGASDYESEYVVANPHPLWMLLAIAAFGIALAWGGYRLCFPRRFR